MQNLSDRALKERIIGAIVLVLVAVLIVPIFLDGPPSEQEVISTSVTLPGQNADNRQQTIVLNRDRSQPVPVSQGQAATQPAATVQAAVEAPAQQDPVAQAAEQQAPSAEAPAQAEADSSTSPAEAPVIAQAAAENATVSATGMWAVQLGSFSNQENAERLAANLRNQGYAAFLSQLQRGGTDLHRVRVGPQKDRESAEAIAAQLGKGGHSGQVVPHP